MIFERQRVFQFRKAVPTDLVAVLARQDVRISLRTGNRRLAQKRAMAMAVALETLFDVLRAEPLSEGGRLLLVQYLQQVQAVLEGGKGHDEIAAIQIPQVISAAKLTPGLEPQAMSFPDFAARLRSEIVADVSALLGNSHRSRFSARPLGEVCDAYLAEIGPSLKGKHAADVPRRLALFVSFVGPDLPVRELERGHIKRYRDLLDRLPDRFQLRLKTGDPVEAVRLNGERKDPFPLLQPETIDLKYLGPAKRLIRWMVDEELIERDVSDGVSSNLATSTIQKSARRLPLSFDELRAFLTFVLKEYPLYSARRWVPLIMSMMGLRLNEACQLHVRDIITYGGRACVSVLCCLDPEAEEKPDNRPVKTLSGRRIVPVPKALLDLGFADLVSERQRRYSGDGPLFPELPVDRHGYRSTALGKRLNRALDKIAPSKRQAVYSLRHGFSEACLDAGLAPHIKDRLMGHAPVGVSGTYGSPVVKPEDVDQIDRLKFPDLSDACAPVMRRRRDVRGDCPEYLRQRVA